MFNRSKTALTTLALLAPLVTVICAIVTWLLLTPLRVDTGQTIPSVKATVTKLTELHPSSVDDPELIKAMQEAAHEPYIASLWLIGPDGRFVRTVGGAYFTPTGSTVDELATDDTKCILAALPEETLNATSRMWLLAASAIRREGEHNDILRHLLRPIQLSNSQPAILGVAYLASAAEIGWVYKSVVLTGLISLIIYWLSLPLWVFLDAKEHGERATVWAAFVLIGNLVALMAYILTRPPRPRAVTT
ncbi:MAG: hypothetical protein ABSA16_13990 [Thermoguttaceae bacterium]|jgi:hypothetical protein